MPSIDAAVAEFRDQGYTIIPGQIDAAWMAGVRATFAAFRAADRSTWGCTDLIERDPEATVHAITRPAVLEIVEQLIGPWIQLESLTLVDFPQAAGGPDVSGWHRDLFATYPQEGVYHRPLLLNAAIYLQDLTPDNGPLRVVPGSHRRAMGITAEQRQAPHPEEQLVYPRAGDVVLFHNALLHSGSANRTPASRFFYCMTYNCAWLKHRGVYAGPNAQAVIARARERGDVRLLRLLGIDDQLVHRANSGFVEPDEVTWRRWLTEDRAALRS